MASSKNSIKLSKLSSDITSDKNKIVIIQEIERNKEPMKFPSVWLRDNCQCSECFHENTKSRIINRNGTKLQHNISVVALEKGENTITINWNDDHQSIFSLNWLQDHNFSPQKQKSYLNEMYKPPPELWGKKDIDKVWRIFDFQKILQDNDVLLTWLQTIAVQGFAMVKNSPHDETVARQLANRIGFIKRTTYGELFEVKSKDNAKNYAYMMTPLELHTDMPYYEYKAGVNILHCLVQSKSKGGSNTMTDGFFVAEKLRQNYPEYYEILLKTPVDWHNIGEDNGLEFHNIWRAPVISLDIDGNYHRIDHNVTKRDSHFNVPIEIVDSWYEAYDKFLQLAHEETIEFKTTPGDVFVFNNLRILHGRTAYEDSPANERHLIGAYVDWDIIYSKMRVLKKNKCKVLP